jgi:F-type H+-transporting ATPase subunit c
MFLKASTAVKDANKQQGNMFVGIAFAEALGIFAFLVALLLMFAV